MSPLPYMALTISKKTQDQAQAMATPHAAHGRHAQGATLPDMQVAYLALEEPAEPALVPLLQLCLHPVLARDEASAVSCSAPALHFIVHVIHRCPVVRQFLTGGDISHGDENDLALNTNIGLAGMVRIEHAALPVVPLHRRNEQVFRDLDFGRSQVPFKTGPCLLAHDVAAFDCDDLAA